MVLRSHDVLHDFYVPQFRVAHEHRAGPGLELLVHAHAAGRYEALCAQLCGVGHPDMRGFVRVEEGAGFDAWLARHAADVRQAPQRGAGRSAGARTRRWRSPRAASAATRSTARSASARPGKACSASRKASTTAPTVLVDEAFLRDFIRNPQSRDIKGFPTGDAAGSADRRGTRRAGGLHQGAGRALKEDWCPTPTIITTSTRRTRRCTGSTATSGARTTRSSRSSTRSSRSSSGSSALVLSDLMRLQLGFPGQFHFIDPSRYYQFITMHGMIMVIYLLTALFLGGFGNYLIPLMCGARDMVFPYMNMLSFWVYLLVGARAAGELLRARRPDRRRLDALPAAGGAARHAGRGTGGIILMLVSLGDLHRRLHDGRPELRDDRAAGPLQGHDADAHAAVGLGHLHGDDPRPARVPGAVRLRA